MREGFIKGMDLSTCRELEECGAKYFDHGVEKDILDIMTENGVTMIRLRLWNDPYDKSGAKYGAGTNDLDTTIYIGKKVTEHGMKVLLDYHYSDFWTDPGKQFKPKAWRTLGFDGLKAALHDFTRDSLKAILDAGVDIGMVQVGNEVTNGLLWPDGKLDKDENYNCDNYPAVAELISAGIDAVRETDDRIPVMIHLDNGGNNLMYRAWFDNYFANGGSDFEYIGLSYYPVWHGTLSDLENNMNDMVKRYNKNVIVAEVSTTWTLRDYAEYEKLGEGERKGIATKKELVEKLEYPPTVEGQVNFTKDFLGRLDKVMGGRGKGFFWWEPGWVPVPGSGWATPASLKYIEDPGPCGNEWANQILFDYEGNMHPTWDVIRDF